MWKVSDIKNGKNYVLTLIQSDVGARKIHLQEYDFKNENSEVIFVTEVIPQDLLIKRNIEKISELILLTNGERFYVDAHGIWLTQTEMNALESDELIDIPWVNGMSPNFAPK